VFGLNLLASANFRNTDLAALLFDRSQRHLLASKDLSQGFAIVCDAFADNDFIQSVAAFENIGWHDCGLQKLRSVHRLARYSWPRANRAGLCVRTGMSPGRCA